MTIEEALEIIDSTNFYTCFTNEKQDEAFQMAQRALKKFSKYREDCKILEKRKGDHVGTLLCGIFTTEIKEVEEGSGDNEKKS